MDGQLSWEKLNTCVFCGTKFPENKHYYACHGTTLEKYFIANFPKHSLVTKRQLPFKNIESYYFHDVLNKEELKTYLNSLNDDDKRAYCVTLLKKRLEIKGQSALPGQIETRSLLMPSVKYYDQLFENGYYALGESLGFTNRFRKLDGALQTVNHQLSMLIDTREQHVLKFKSFRRKIQKLDYGDYRLETIEYGNAAVERKNITDFISSFGKNLDRLEKEIDRAISDNGYLYILVEESLQNALKFNTLPYVSRKIKATPDFLFYNVRKIMQLYSNVQFVFVKNRADMEKFIPFVLVNHNVLRSIDLQLYYDVFWG